MYASPPQYSHAPASWPLTFWPWKWCSCHVWRGLPVCQFWLSVLELFPMYAIQTSDRRQTKASLYAPPRGWGIIIAACINLLYCLSLTTVLHYRVKCEQVHKLFCENSHFCTHILVTINSTNGKSTIAASTIARISMRQKYSFNCHWCPWKYVWGSRVCFEPQNRTLSFKTGIG